LEDICNLKLNVVYRVVYFDDNGSHSVHAWCKAMEPFKCRLHGVKT